MTNVPRQLSAFNGSLPVSAGIDRQVARKGPASRCSSNGGHPYSMSHVVRTLKLELELNPETIVIYTARLPTRQDELLRGFCSHQEGRGVEWGF